MSVSNATIPSVDNDLKRKLAIESNAMIDRQRLLASLPSTSFKKPIQTIEDYFIPLAEDHSCKELNFDFENISFKKIKKLGAGKEGAVYLVEGRDKNISALKIPHQEVSFLEKEYNIGVRLNHQNIVKIDTSIPFDKRFLKLEFIDGCNLSEYIQKNELSFQQSIQLTNQAIAAGRHLIEKGVLPWDLMSIKNLMVNNDGNLKYIDFGSYFLFEDEKGNIDEQVCNENHSPLWCVFRGSLGDIASIAIKILQPHKEKLIDSLFYQKLYDEANWMAGPRPSLWLFPSLQSGATVSGACDPIKKKEHMIAFLTELEVSLHQFSI